MTRKQASEAMTTNEELKDMSRRNAAMKMLAGAGLVGLASSCVSDPESQVTQELGGGSFQWVDTIGWQGKSTGVSSTTLTDMTQNWVTNRFVGDTVATGGKTGTVTANTATTVTVSSWVGGTPASALPYTVGGIRSLVGSDTATASKPVVVVGGYSKVGDGGGGVFYWDKSSSTGDNGGTIFVPPGSTTGRWVRVAVGHINVRWFGAAGNAVGASTTIGDTDCIQRAIDYAASLGGGTVFFPQGVYIVASPDAGNTLAYKVLLRSNVSLLGVGISSELRSTTNANINSRILAMDPMLAGVGGYLDNVTIQGLHLNGQEASQTMAGTNYQRAAIFIDRGRNIQILDCVIHDCCDGIRGHALFERCTIARNEIYNVKDGRECVSCTGEIRDVIVENNHIHDSPGATAVKFFEGTNPSPGTYFSNVIHGNVCKNVGGGINAVYGAIISDNIIEAVIAVGIQCGPSCHVTGNRIIKAVEIGIQLQGDSSGTSPIDKLIIANNTITGLVLPVGAPWLQGIAAAGLSTMKAKFVTITGNFIENPGSSPFMGIRFDTVSGNLMISGNTILNARYGITMSVGVNNTVENVQINGNIVTLTTNGWGITYGQDPSVNAYLRHLIVNGNIISKVTPSVFGTIGIANNGSGTPSTSVIIIGNDFSGTDTAYYQTTGTVGNLP